MQSTQKEVRVYSREACPYCTMAKQLLTTKGVTFQEIVVAQDDNQAKADLVKRTGHKTFPQIFVGEKFLGGYRELEELEKSGELDRLLMSLKE